jgi:hypothetical protein
MLYSDVVQGSWQSIFNILFGNKLRTCVSLYW